MPQIGRDGKFLPRPRIEIRHPGRDRVAAERRQQGCPLARRQGRPLQPHRVTQDRLQIEGPIHRWRQHVEPLHEARGPAGLHHVEQGILEGGDGRGGRRRVLGLHGSRRGRGGRRPRVHRQDGGATAQGQQAGQQHPALQAGQEPAGGQVGHASISSVFRLTRPAPKQPAPRLRHHLQRSTHHPACGIVSVRVREGVTSPALCNCREPSCALRNRSGTPCRA